MTVQTVTVISLRRIFNLATSAWEVIQRASNENDNLCMPNDFLRLAVVSAVGGLPPWVVCHRPAPHPVDFCRRYAKRLILRTVDCYEGHGISRTLTKSIVIIEERHKHVTFWMRFLSLVSNPTVFVGIFVASYYIQLLIFLVPKAVGELKTCRSIFTCEYLGIPRLRKKIDTN